MVGRLINIDSISTIINQHSITCRRGWGLYDRTQSQLNSIFPITVTVTLCAGRHAKDVGSFPTMCQIDCITLAATLYYRNNF